MNHNKWDRRDSKQQAKRKIRTDNRRSVRWLYMKSIRDSNKVKAEARRYVYE